MKTGTGSLRVPYGALQRFLAYPRQYIGGKLRAGGISLVWAVFIEGFHREVENTVRNRAEVARLRLNPMINTSLYWEIHQPSGAILEIPNDLLRFRVLTRKEWDQKLSKLPPEYQEVLLPIVEDLLASEHVKWIECDCGKGYAPLVRKNRSCYRCLRTMTPQQRLWRRKKQARKSQIRRR